mmetsp:Transcript_7540/g.19124  ORF Transcript_7540/g.19124 Transcript_7540/m.19124 type:complete len:202 (+) Transcript_7540:201-806(+)
MRPPAQHVLATPGSRRVRQVQERPMEHSLSHQAIAPRPAPRSAAAAVSRGLPEAVAGAGATRKAHGAATAPPPLPLPRCHHCPAALRGSGRNARPKHGRGADTLSPCPSPCTSAPQAENPRVMPGSRAAARWYGFPNLRAACRSVEAPSAEGRLHPETVQRDRPRALRHGQQLDPPGRPATGGAKRSRPQLRSPAATSRDP